MNASILKSYNSIIFSSVKNDRRYVDSKFITLNKTIETKLSKTGGEVLGHINMNDNTLRNVKNPVDDKDVVSKVYVDSSLQKVNDEFQSKVNNSNGRIITLSESIEGKLSRNGGDIVGSINMNNNKITNVRTPIHNQDVVNKIYVDSRLRENNHNFVTDEIDMRWNNIVNLRFPADSLDAVNRLYLEQLFFPCSPGNIF